MTINKEQILEDLSNQIDELKKKINPCKSSITENGFKCIADASCCVGYPSGDKCEHLGDNGCKINCICCKMWLCQNALDNMTEEQKNEWNNLIYNINKQMIQTFKYIIFREDNSCYIKNKAADYYVNILDENWYNDNLQVVKFTKNYKKTLDIEDI